MKSIYLAGPITGLNYEGATDWRKLIFNRMDGPRYQILSPMRAKEYLSNLDEITAQGYQDTILSNAKAIVTRDRNDTMKCDLVIMNLLGATKVSIGTMIELGWADAARVPVVLIMEKEEFEGDMRKTNIHDHAMVTEMAGFRVSTLDEAVLVARTILY